MAKENHGADCLAVWGLELGLPGTLWPRCPSSAGDLCTILSSLLVHPAACTTLPGTRGSVLPTQRNPVPRAPSKQGDRRYTEERTDAMPVRRCGWGAPSPRVEVGRALSVVPVGTGLEGWWLPQRPEWSPRQGCTARSPGAQQQEAGAHPPFKRTTWPPKGTKSLDRTREVARKQGQLSIMFLPVFL